jgi:hypothetical protein
MSFLQHVAQNLQVLATKPIVGHGVLDPGFNMLDQKTPHRHHHIQYSRNEEGLTQDAIKITYTIGFMQLIKE